MGWLYVPPALLKTVDVKREAVTYDDGVPSPSSSSIYSSVQVAITPVRVSTVIHARGETEDATHRLFSPAILSNAAVGDYVDDGTDKYDVLSVETWPNHTEMLLRKKV